MTSHDHEVAAGTTWRRCGYRSEWATLEAVLLARPPDALAAVRDPDDALMLHTVDLDRMRRQGDRLGEVLAGEGVEVIVDDRCGQHPANIVFQRDLYAVTPQGAVLGRMASRQRAGEERWAARALAEADVPILRTVTGDATLEGADVLRVADDLVLVGVGFRTNDAGAAVVADVYGAQGVRVQPVPLGPGVQHLLGGLQIVDDRLALIRRTATTPETYAVLDRLGYRYVVLEEDECEVNGGIGLVTLGPSRVLLASAATALRRRLDRAGVESVPVEMGEYLAAAGGPGCVLGIVRRSDAVVAPPPSQML